MKEETKEVKNAEVEPDETEQVNRCYRHVNQLEIYNAPWSLGSDKKIGSDNIVVRDSKGKGFCSNLTFFREDINTMKLISASPDLYEALSEIIDWEYHLDMDSVTVDMIKKALNKASGKSVD